MIYSTGLVLEDKTFLPKKTLKLTEFDQKQSLGSGGVEYNGMAEAESDTEIGIRCWTLSHTNILKLLSLCPALKTIRLLVEENQLANIADVLSEMQENFDIQEMEVIGCNLNGLEFHLKFNKSSY